MRQVGPPEPVLRGAASVPGTTLTMRSAGTPNCLASVSAVVGLVTMQPASAGNIRPSTSRSHAVSSAENPASSDVG